MSATHGLASTYRSTVYACRCDECRAAHAERFRHERQARRERLTEEASALEHGTKSTYSNWGCRCAPCTEANKRAFADRRKSA